MTLLALLSERWKAQNPVLFPEPSVLLGFYAGKWYITLEDNKSVCMFLSDESQVYAAVKFKCEPRQIEGVGVAYVISENEALQIISCSKNKEFSPLSGFAARNLASLVFPK